MLSKKFFEGLDRETLVCARCGCCRVDCPVYNTAGWESYAPRSRMKSVRDIVRQGVAADRQSVERLFACTFCGKCRDVCPTDIDTMKVWQEAREKAASLKLLPDNLEKLAYIIDKKKNITGDEAANREIWLSTLGEGFQEHVGKRSELAYFPGCSGSLYPAAGSVPKSFVQILSLAGVDFTLLGQAEECCGFPLIGCGKWTQAASMVRENVNNIMALGVKRVVTTCPSCFRTIKEGWPGFLESDLPFEVIHASQFLEELVTNSCISFDEQAETVTYHDPCDLGRNSGIYEAPRRVIQSIPGIRLVEMKKNRQDADCCGGGGNLEATDARLSENIALRRIQEAQGTGAGTIISCCQQCKRVLSNAARKNKIKVRVLDLTEFVFKAMKKT